MDHWCTCGCPAGADGKRLIGRSCENLCKVEWYHLSCVGLYDLPAGDWYCDECAETGNAPAETGFKYSFCKRGSQFGTIVECTNVDCLIKRIHKSCIPQEDVLCDDWMCSSCT